jgi:ABC-type lipoprotein release transport system permease subunit
MLIKLAFLNLGRNRRRTLLTLSSLVISAAMLILSLGIFSGMFDDMLSSATDNYTGHITISRPDYQQEHDLYLNFSPTPALLEQLQHTPGITGLSERLRAFGLLSGQDQSRPAELLGVDFAQEPQVTTLNKKLIAGTFPSSSAAGQGVIGSALARRLNVAVGDELVLVSQAADGSIANALLTISGIFDSGDQLLNTRLALVDLHWLQTTMALPGKVHEIVLRCQQPLKAATLAATLQQQLGDTEEVLDWGKRLPQMQEVIASYDISRLIFVAILYSAAALGVLNTFYMAVLERATEFGVLLALGMSPRRLRWLVVLESLLLGALALVGALLLGGALTWWMSHYGIDLSNQLSAVTYAGGTIPPRLHAVHDWNNYLIPSLCLLLVSIAASYLPARRASRLQPVDVLRRL